MRSRCQVVRFAPLRQEAVEAHLAERGLGEDAEERRAAARLAAASRTGRRSSSPTRAASCALRPRRASPRRCSGELDGAPWRALLTAAEAAGEQAAEEARQRSAAWQARRGGERGAAAPAPRARGRGGGQARRAGAPEPRRLDLGLALIAAWLRDLAAVAEGAEQLVLNCRSPRRAARGAAAAASTAPRPRVAPSS